MQINGDTASDYYSSYICNLSGTATENTTGNAYVGQIGYNADQGPSPSSVEITFQDYTSTASVAKIFRTELNNSVSGSGSQGGYGGGSWYDSSSFAAITSLLFNLNSAGNFAAGSYFTIYGTN